MRVLWRCRFVSGRADGWLSEEYILPSKPQLLPRKAPTRGPPGRTLSPAPLSSAMTWAFISIFLVTALCVSGCAKINRMQHLKSIEIRAARQQRVQEAYQKASKVIARRAAEFSNFIHSRKSGAKSFSQDLVSPYGRWRAVSPYLPTQRQGGS